MNVKTLRATLLPALLSLGLVVGAADTFAAPPAGGATAKAAKKNKIVMQVSDGDTKKWILALSNARNVQAELGKGNVDIEIVVYGPAIAMLEADSEVGNLVEEALTNGVRLVACENTMHGQKLTRDDMLPNIAYVKAGVVHLMRRQQQGYAYIRP